MTVYNWVRSFGLGETRYVPSNCTANDLIHEAAIAGITLLLRPDVWGKERLYRPECKYCGR